MLLTLACFHWLFRHTGHDHFFWIGEFLFDAKRRSWLTYYWSICRCQIKRKTADWWITTRMVRFQCCSVRVKVELKHFSSHTSLLCLIQEREKKGAAGWKVQPAEGRHHYSSSTSQWQNAHRHCFLHSLCWGHGLWTSYPSAEAAGARGGRVVQEHWRPRRSAREVKFSLWRQEATQVRVLSC